jgi:membrane protein YqaA with SNARE-associated domain
MITPNYYASVHMAILSTIIAGLIAYIIGMYADRSKQKQKKLPPKIVLDDWKKRIS